MRKLFNQLDQKSARKRLRSNMTDSEILLWSRLKGSQAGYKFRRQQGIGNYVVDFYCSAAKLAIELDGAHHFTPDGEMLDATRDDFLSAFGVAVIRFVNNDVMDDVEKVLDRIVRCVRERVTDLGQPPL